MRFVKCKNNIYKWHFVYLLLEIILTRSKNISCVHVTLVLHGQFLHSTLVFFSFWVSPIVSCPINDEKEYHCLACWGIVSQYTVSIWPMESYLLVLSVLLRPAKHLKQFKHTHYKIRNKYFLNYYLIMMNWMNNLRTTDIKIIIQRRTIICPYSNPRLCKMLIFNHASIH